MMDRVFHWGVSLARYRVPARCVRAHSLQLVTRWGVDVGDAPCGEQRARGRCKNVTTVSTDVAVFPLPALARYELANALPRQNA